MSNDPLAEVVTLLQPSARFSKSVECSGAWRVHREETGEPFFCAVVEGSIRVIVDGQPAITLEAGDFMLVPTMHDLITEGMAVLPDGVTSTPVEVSPGCFRIGQKTGPADARMQVGHCSFASPDAELLVSLLPQIVVARREPRLTMLMQLIGEETRACRPARELVLQRLLEVMLIESLRCGSDTASAPGLARGLADECLAVALRAIHARPEHSWTVGRACHGCGPIALGFFRAFQSHRGRAADGVSAGVADGAGEATVAAKRVCHGTGCRERGL